MQIFEVIGWDGVEVAIPHCDVGVFAWLEGADALFEKELVRGPDGVGPERGVDVDRLGRTEGLQTVHAVQCFANDRGPQAISRRIRSNEIIRAACPDDVLLSVSFVRHEALHALCAEGCGVNVANPPHERCLRFRIAGIEIALEASHSVYRVVGGDVAVNDAVTQALGRFLFQSLGIRINDPVDCAITHGMRAYMNSGVVKQFDHFTIDRRIDIGVASVAGVDFPGFLEPGIIDPGGAPAAASVHVEFDAS